MSVFPLPGLQHSSLVSCFNESLAIGLPLHIGRTHRTNSHPRVTAASVPPRALRPIANTWQLGGENLPEVNIKKVTFEVRGI